MAMVDIILVLFNSSSYIPACLSCLEKQSFKDFSVIAVDNDSTDHSIRLLKEIQSADFWKNRLQILALKQNTGFAEGNLAGYRIGKGKYIATLNVDAEVEKKWLKNLVACIEENPEIGICASKLAVYGRDVIDSAGDTYSTLLKGYKRGEGQDIRLYETKEHVFGACAGAALYRRKMLEQIGFFDDDFFLIHEDTDLNFRAQLAGWKVLYVPSALVHHKVRSSIGNMSDMAVYYSLRNSEFVRIKNVPFEVFLRCAPEFALGTISEFLYFVIKHKKLRLFIKAKTDAIKMFPRMWQKRRIIMKSRKVSNDYLLSLMTPIWQKDFFKSKLGKFLNG